MRRQWWKETVKNELSHPNCLPLRSSDTAVFHPRVSRWCSPGDNHLEHFVNKIREVGMDSICFKHGVWISKKTSLTCIRGAQTINTVTSTFDLWPLSKHFIYFGQRLGKFPFSNSESSHSPARDWREAAVTWPRLLSLTTNYTKVQVNACAIFDLLSSCFWDVIFNRERWLDRGPKSLMPLAMAVTLRHRKEFIKSKKHQFLPHTAPFNKLENNLKKMLVRKIPYLGLEEQYLPK